MHPSEFPEITVKNVKPIIERTCEGITLSPEDEGRAVSELGIDSVDFLDVSLQIQGFNSRMRSLSYSQVSHLTVAEWVEEMNGGTLAAQ